MTDEEKNALAPVSKIRFRFAKTDDLRFCSHHDLMRLMERLLRRAGLPFCSTAGFHPKPKIVFASALGLGIVGRGEVVEIEFHGSLDPHDVLNVLSKLAPEGLCFLVATIITPRQNAQPCRAMYFLPLPLDTFPDLEHRLQQLFVQEHLPIERVRNMRHSVQEEPLGEERLDALTHALPTKMKCDHKVIDLRRFINNLWRDERGLWMDLAITNQGAARPEEVLRLLELENIMLDGDAILERVQLELEDEVTDSLDLMQEFNSPFKERCSSESDVSSCETSSNFANN